MPSPGCRCSNEAPPALTGRSSRASYREELHRARSRGTAQVAVSLTSCRNRSTTRDNKSVVVVAVAAGLRIRPPGAAALLTSMSAES